MLSLTCAARWPRDPHLPARRLRHGQGGGHGEAPGVGPVRCRAVGLPAKREHPGPPGRPGVGQDDLDRTQARPDGRRVDLPDPRGMRAVAHQHGRERDRRPSGPSRRRRSLLRYPHFIGTIQSFVHTFLGLPAVRARKVEVRSIDDAAFETAAFRLLQRPEYSTLRSYVERQHQGTGIVTGATFTYRDGVLAVTGSARDLPFGAQSSSGKRALGQGPVSWLTGLPPPLSFFFRLAAWSFFSGMNDRLDTAFAQVGTLAARRVSLVSGDCVRPGARAADGPAHPHPAGVSFRLTGREVTCRHGP